ncbi:hypothetical protein BV25DRAFT_1885404 [Artomyces pyxidatus]|uniref:Uncharacterized protein n=1 Tax=Artomyces pyxidatus TaxID=48021 RepID=A0ACB8T0C6_9AGAM|nr:hypothetical protein BV25DRAFT_1885404 [Artomyces pyxidatus]
MTQLDRCKSCCLTCRFSQSLGEPTASPSQADDPFAVQNLIPAGTISLNVAWTESLCDHRHAEDNWHYFLGEALLPHLLHPDQVELCRQIDFLILHKFLAARCSLGASGILHCRIYVIPFDLPNVRGSLRNRDEFSVLKPARACLRNVLPRVVQDMGSWHSDDSVPSTRITKYFLDAKVDNRRLAEIYGSLPSPHLDDISFKACSGKSRNLIQRVLSGRDVDGLRSRLYMYQRRSVSVMLCKELSPSDMPDPVYIPLYGLHGSACYFQPATLEVLRERPMVAPVHGGVLCEELGTGKTVMVLALILATIDQLSQPEESIHDPRPVMTPLAFHYFPQAQFVAARRRAFRKNLASSSPSATHSVPTLLETLLHHIRTNPDGFDLSRRDDWLDDRGLGDVLRLNSPYYLHYEDPLPTASRFRRKTSDNRGPRLVYLTSATLIVVPPNLLLQWDSEIQKHCDGSFLRVLVVRPKDTLPRAKVLASNYDIILMNHDSFAKEEARSDLTEAHTWKMCECPGYRDTRVPNCQCDISTVSSLFQIRWKRLVVDEGHVHGTDKTRISVVANLLSVERRWLVTGTPTTDLLGLSFGSQSELFDEDMDPLYPDTVNGLDNATLPLAEETSDATALAGPRLWGVQDRENLRRLASMIISFLRVPRFTSMRHLFATHVVYPLFRDTGPQPGALQVLVQTMSSIMVRHRIEDIEDEIVLPSLKHETVLLDLDPIVVKSYNALQTVIISNAVDSERTDQDYLFHPQHAAELRLLVENMSQCVSQHLPSYSLNCMLLSRIMFWRVDEDIFNLQELSNNIDPMIQRAKDRNISPDDLRLLCDSKIHIESAINDATWCAIQKYPIPEMPYLVTNIPKTVFSVWSELPKVPLDLTTSSPELSGIMFPYRLNKLRRMLVTRPLISEQDLVFYGLLQAKDDAARIAEFMHTTSAKTKGKKKPSDSRETVKASETARHVMEPDKLEDMRRELQIAASKQTAVDEVPFSREWLVRPQHDAPILLQASPLRDARIVRSRSSKLDYLLRDVISLILTFGSQLSTKIHPQVLQYSTTEKFLIFSKSPLTLAHVADALDVAGVKYLQYTTEVTLRIREQLVTTFETSDTFRVFLMELKHGSRGLNVISASRVIFCEPVWQADVEAQAIKRAHRIGQTKSITVKTLAIRDTFEEIMASRRAELKNQDQRATGLTDDLRMRHFIANPKFLTPTSYTPIILDIPLRSRPSTAELLLSSQPMTLPAVDPAPVDGANDEQISNEPPQKKRVRFG